MSGKHRRRRRVLVVDRSLVYRNSLGNFFAMRDYDVQVAATAEAAEAAAEQWPPDLLVSEWDLGAETMDGLALATRLRRAAPELRCVLIGAAPGAEALLTEDQRRWIETLAKPFNLADLAPLVEPDENHA